MAINDRIAGTTRITLSAINRRPSLKAKLAGRKVYIWSGRHQAWWAPEGHGYVRPRDRAGVFDFEDAWRRSSHASPENQVAYEFVVEPEAD